MIAATETGRIARWWPFQRDESWRNIALFEIAAVVVGVLWYLAMMVSRVRGNPFTEYPEAEDPSILCAAFVLTSVAVSTAFRSRILRSSSRSIPVLGTVLMFVGAALFAIVCLLEVGALDDSVEWSSPWFNLENVFVLVAAPAIAMFLSASMFYVTIPMGIASVFLLRRVDWLARPRSAAVG